MSLRQDLTVISHGLLFLRHVDLYSKFVLQELTVDVPGMIFDIVSKMVIIIFLSVKVNHQVVTVFASLLNRCLRRDAFTVTQKQKFSSWLQRMRTLWNPPQILKAKDYWRR